MYCENVCKIFNIFYTLYFDEWCYCESHNRSTESILKFENCSYTLMKRGNSRKYRHYNFIYIKQNYGWTQTHTHICTHKWRVKGLKKYIKSGYIQVAGNREAEGDLWVNLFLSISLWPLALWNNSFVPFFGSLICLPALSTLPSSTATELLIAAGIMLLMPTFPS